MNIVIICGKIISKIEFKFIYDRYKNNASIQNKDNEIYKHISIAKCKIKLSNDSIIEIHGYDSVADYMYRKIKENDNIYITGKIIGNGVIIVEKLYKFGNREYIEGKYNDKE